MPAEDQMAREVARRELAMQEKQSSKRGDAKYRKKLELKGKYISKKVRKKNATVERVVEKKN